MILNQNDKEKVRELLIKRLERLSDNEMLSLPKGLLEELLFDYYEIKVDRKSKGIIQALAINSRLLSKIDTSEISFNDTIFLKSIITLVPSKTNIKDMKEYDDTIVEIGGIINNTPSTKKSRSLKLEK